MRKLTKEERAKLESLVKKLDTLDPNSSDAKAIREELIQITNEFAEVSNKVQKNINSSEKPIKKVVNKKVHYQEDKKQIANEIKNKVKKKNLEIENLDEEQLLDNDSFIEVIKTIIELNQECINYSLVALENSNDIQSHRIKKCIDLNVENKRKLKSILKECIDLL